MMHRLPMVLIVGLGSSSAACAPPEELVFGAPVYEGARLDVWASEGLTACGGTYAYMDRWLADFRAVAGELPTVDHHRYYWVSESDWDQHEPCPGDACAYSSGPIYALDIPIEHELVHADAHTQSATFLSEGLAEVFGSVQGLAPRRDADLRTLLESERLANEQYSTAGHFARSIIDRHGIDAYIRWTLASSRGDSFDELDAAWQAIASSSLPDELVAHQSVPACMGFGWKLDFAECSAPAMTQAADDVWEWSLRFECPSQEVVGPRAGQMWATRTFDVEADGTYLVAVDAAQTPDSLLLLQRCGNVCEEALEPPRNFPTGIPLGGEQTLQLQTGRYWLKLIAAQDANPAVTITITVAKI